MNDTEYEDALEMSRTVLLFNPRPHPILRPTSVPLSLLCISRFLDKDGYNIKIVSGSLYDNYFDIIRQTAAESIVFGVSSMTGYQIYEGLKASKVAKEANNKIKVIWGGWHPSLYPIQTLENPLIDIVVKGQGEKAFYETVKRIEAAKNFENIPGVYWKENDKIYSNPDRQLEPLDGMPPIPYHLVDIDKCIVETEYGHRTIDYISSYGCPYRCGFCSEPTVNKRRWVGLNAEAVVDDIEKLEKVFKIDAVSIIDSNFFININRVKAILQGMLDRKLTIRLGSLDGRAKQLAKADEELWELLRATQCYSILTGAESGSQEALNIINKDISVEDTIKFAEKCHKYGIKVLFTTLVGIPIIGLTCEEIAKKTDEQIVATINMFDKVLSLDHRHRGMMFIFCSYPGTALYEDAVKLGFNSPKSLEEWSKFNFYENHNPWVTEKQSFFVVMLSSYIFMFLDSDALKWVKGRIKNRLKRTMFVITFKILTIIAKLRWKYKFFAFPVDYHLFLLAKKRNKSI